MEFMAHIKKAVNAALFNGQALEELAADKQANGTTFLIIALAGVLYGLLAVVTSPLIGIIALITYPILMIIGFFIAYSIYHFIAKICGGEAKGTEFFRGYGSLMVVSWLNIIPFVNILVSLWLTALLVFTIHRLHKFNVFKSILIVITPIIIVLLIFGGLLIRAITAAI